MSTTIDQRVVEMQFDNAHFERNVATTMSSLDKLKQSLRLSDASKGFENVSSAAKGVNLTGLGSAVETVGLKFSAMYTIADQALRNITNSAMNAGKRIISALTVDPIKTGFSEYETQINAVQTILANTKSKGTSLDDVNQALDELNAYADKTIYNFTEMTRNIGTFTAAGIDLDTSVNAIQGIANLAAVSGSTSQQASTAMYQLSQALASGTVKLMDWNSVVNAGMGGQIFQDALKETSELLGTGAEAAIKAEGSFRESLKNGWLTSEVLTETLKKFTSSGAIERVAEYTGMSADVVSAAMESAKAQYGEADAIKYASEALAKKSGKNADEIKSTLEFAQNAEDAATKVKTLTQLWDTLKEAAQSGWTQTWEIIVGDFEEAKKLFTKVSDTIGEMINKSSESRNNLLSAALGDESSTPFKNVTNSMLEWSDAQLTAAGYTEKQIAVIRQLGQTVKETNKPLDVLTKGLTRSTGRELIIDALWNSFDAVLKIMKPVKEAFREVFPPITANRLYEMIEGFNKFTKSLIISDDTADKIKTTFKGVFSVVAIGVNALKAIGSGILDLLSNFKGLGTGILGATSSFGEWLIGLRETVNETDIFATAVDKVTGFISNLIEKLKEFHKSAKESFESSGFSGFIGFLKLIWNFSMKIVSSFGRAFAAIGEAFVETFTGSYIDNILNTGLFAVLIMGIKKVVDTLKDILEGGEGFFDNIKGILDDVRGCFESYQNNLNAEALKKIATAVAILAASILLISFINPDKLDQSLGAITVMFAELMASMALVGKIGGANMKGVMKVVPLMIGMSTAILMLSGALKLISTIDAEGSAQALLSIGVLMGELVGAIYLFTLIGGKNIKSIQKASSTLIGMSVAVLILSVAMKTLSSMNADEAAQGLMSVGVLLAELAIFSKIAGESNHIVSTGLAMILLGGALVILAEAVKSFADMSWDEIGRGLASMAGSLVAITAALNFMPKNMIAIGVGFTIVSAAMLILAEAMKSMSEMGAEESAKAVTIMGVALLELVVALNAMKGSISGAAALLIASASLAVLASVMKTLGELSWEQVIRGLVTIAASLTLVGVAGLLLAPLLPTILGLAAAFAIFGIATVGIGAGLTLIGVGLTAIATGFTALAVAGTAAATAVVSSLSIVILGLADLIPEIASRLGEAIIAFANVIGNCAPQIAEAVLKLVVEVLRACEEYAPQIVDSLLGFLIGILDALSGRLPELIVSAVGVISAFFKGVVDALSGLDTATIFEGIVGVALMSGLMLALSAVASLIPGAMVGVLGMGVVIAELALVLAAIGLLAQIPGLEWLINEGGNFLQSIGTAIGQFFGGILGGIAQGAASTLPQIGTHLSEFITNATPFLEGIKTIDTEALNGVKTLTSIILTLTAAGVLDGITSWLTGGSSLTNFAEQIVPFGKALTEFSQTVAGNIDESAVTAAANAGKIMVELADSLPNTGGVISWFTGDNALDDFGEQILSFGRAMVDFSEIISGHIDAEAVLAAASAGTMMAELANNLPDSGGFASVFTKDNDMSTFGKELVKFGESITDFSEEVEGIDLSKISSVVDQFKKVAEMAASISSMNFEGLRTLGTSLNEVSKTAVNRFVDAFKDAGDRAYTAASDMIASLISGVEAKTASVGNVFSNMMTDILSKINVNIKAFREAGANMVTNIVDGISNNTESVTNVVGNLAKSASNALRGAYASFYNAGGYLAAGFAQGISANDYKAVARSRAMASKALKAAEAELDINSPSKKAYKMGSFYGLGFVNAIGDYVDVAYKASSDMSSSAYEGLSKSIVNLSSMFDANIDVQPTIRPVLDLSEVKAGAGTISNLFNGNPSVGVLANVNGISSMMNTKVQNGTNSDVISAIDRLRSDIRGMDRSTYNINGVTYDDGSNISDAVRTIVRAARIERRS